MSFSFSDISIRISPEDEIIMQTIGLLKDEYYAIKAYTILSYHMMDMMKVGSKCEDVGCECHRMVNGLISGFNKLKMCCMNRRLYAGIKFSIKDRWLSMFPRSTSTYIEDSFVRSSPVNLIFINPKNVSNISSISMYPSQHEHVLLPNQCYEVIDVSQIYTKHGLSKSIGTHTILHLLTVPEEDCKDGDHIIDDVKLMKYLNGLDNHSLYSVDDNDTLSHRLHKYIDDVHDYDLIDAYGNTVLHYAFMEYAANGVTCAMLLKLLESSDINAVNNLGQTPLMKYFSSAKYLVAFHISNSVEMDDYIDDDIDEDTDHSEIMRLIETSQLDVNITDCMGVTMFMVMIASNISPLDYKLSFDESIINAVNIYDESVISYCRTESHIDIITTMGFVPVISVLEEYFNLHMNNRNVSVLNGIMKWDDDINRINCDGESYLMRCKCDEEMKILIDHGIDIHIKNNRGETVTYYSQSINIVKLLRSNGLSYDITNIYKQTPLMVILLKYKCVNHVIMHILAHGGTVCKDINGNLVDRYMNGMWYQ